MASADYLPVLEKPRRTTPACKLEQDVKCSNVSPKEILSIMSGKFNDESVSNGAAVKKKLAIEEPTPISTHKMALCRVCGRLGHRIRFLTAQRDICSRACEAEKDVPLTKPVVPWIDFVADLTIITKREARLPERSSRRRGHAGGSFRWQDACANGADIKAAPVHCFPHAPAIAMWARFGQGSGTLPPFLAVETELSAADANASALWVARVTAVRGYMARLRFEGVDDPARDFWVNLAAQTYPLGWAAANGRPLIPPKATTQQRDDNGWIEFLATRLRGCQTLPWNFARQIAESHKARFTPGMLLELVDKDQITRMRLACVESVSACRLHMRYVDADEADPGFVCHQDSPLIRPVGWAHRVGAIVSAPTDYLLRCERQAFLPEDASAELFVSPPLFVVDPDHRIVAGMKLEAIDPLNLSAICVGTVAKVLREGYLMVRIESYEEEDNSRADWFCYHAASPSIFRAGFCQRNGLSLVPPKAYVGTAFTWERYLSQTGAKPAPLPPHEPLAHGFAVGHLLEAADLMDPRKVCAASVAQVVGRLLRVHFDGWGSEYDQWMDAKSPDIYPVGWCEMTGHRLEPPCGTTAPPRSLGTVVNITRPRAPRRETDSESDADSDACPVLAPVSPAKPWLGNANHPPRLRKAAGGRARAGRKPVRTETGNGAGKLRTGDVKTEGIVVKTEPVAVKTEVEEGFETLASDCKGDLTRPKRTLPKLTPDIKPVPPTEAISTPGREMPELRAPRRLARTAPRFLRSSISPREDSDGSGPRTRSADRVPRRAKTGKEGPKEREKGAAFVAKEQGKSAVVVAKVQSASADDEAGELGKGSAVGVKEREKSTVDVLKEQEASADLAARKGGKEAVFKEREKSTVDVLKEREASADVSVVGKKELGCTGTGSSGREPVRGRTRTSDRLPVPPGSSEDDEPLLTRLAKARKSSGRFGSPSRKRPAAKHAEEPPAKVPALKTADTKMPATKTPTTATVPSKAPAPVATVTKVSPAVAAATTSVPAESKAAALDVEVPAKEKGADRTEGGLRLPHANDVDPHRWSKRDVAAFLQANDCGAFASAFMLKNIDGSTFMTMNDTNIILLTSTKVGPALLIADLIQRLKTLCQQRKRIGSQRMSS